MFVPTAAAQVLLMALSRGGTTSSLTERGLSSEVKPNIVLMYVMLPLCLQSRLSHAHIHRLPVNGNRDSLGGCVRVVRD